MNPKYLIFFKQNLDFAMFIFNLALRKDPATSSISCICESKSSDDVVDEHSRSQARRYYLVH